mmetsp:Transcript_20305/g.30588  ORF Transcript_20305/g.30588 Transcript_20305/m.30588 type:complete len:510 (-) Transcript_20305:92-1621(-)
MSTSISQEKVISPSQMKLKQRSRYSQMRKIPPSPKDNRKKASNATSSDRSPRKDEVRSPRASTRRTSSSSPRSSPAIHTTTSPRIEPAVQKIEPVVQKPKDADELQTDLQQQMLASLKEPDASLKALLDVLTDPSATHHRRVNACGAIKTLTLKKTNQIPLVRTAGVVSSLTTVLCTVAATEEERTRCINALMQLCIPEENWKMVYLFPHTAEALARNMADKYPQIRYAACLSTSFLAKKNRKEMASNRILMYAIARVIEVDKNGNLEKKSAKDKKVLIAARLCTLKMLLHLSKDKDVSPKLARMESITTALVTVANHMEKDANILCMATLTNLTRHPDNLNHLMFKVPKLASIFVTNVEGSEVECGKCALYALQNLSCDSNCRQELANTPNLLGSVTKAAFKHDCPEQQLSALHTLKNLSDDPFNLVTMTNTPGCTATLLALANNSGSGMAQYLACDTLATLSHWLLTLSARKNTKMMGDEKDGAESGAKRVEMGRRTFETSTYQMWT